MKTYMSVKLVEAEPMTSAMFNNRIMRQARPGEDPYAKGYLVRYPDGYEGWCPEEAFDKTHLELDNPTKITAGVVKRFVHEYKARTLDEKTTHVTMKTASGFLVHDTSSCVDPENYDENVGQDLAAARCEDKLWGFLGFVLQWAINGLKHDSTFKQ